MSLFSKKKAAQTVVSRVDEVRAEIEATRQAADQAEQHFAAAALREANLERELEEARLGAILELMQEAQAEHAAALKAREQDVRALDAHLLAIEPIFRRIAASEGKLHTTRRAYDKLAKEYGVDPSRRWAAGGKCLEPLPSAFEYGFQVSNVLDDGRAILSGGLLGVVPNRLQWLKYGQGLANKFSEDV